MTGNAVPAWTEQPTPFAITPEPWVQDALCATTDPEAFFPHKDDATKIREALATCAACPVQAQCLEFAQRTRQKHGIYGGLTANQRARLRRKENAA